MATTLPKIPYSIAVGAQASFGFDVSKNTGESGVSSRKAMRPILRNYMLTVNPADSDDIMKLVMVVLGSRYPFLMRDYHNNYRLQDEVLPHTADGATLGRTWVYGPMSIFERILFIDEAERAFVVKVNGLQVSYVVSDFGLLAISGGLVDSDVVTVTGDYLVPVCFIDAPSSSAIVNANGVTLHKFSDLRLEQIFEAEVRRLLINPNDPTDNDYASWSPAL